MAEVRLMKIPLTQQQLTVPLRISVVYVAGTLLLYFVGTYGATDPNTTQVGLFMLAVLTMFVLGYWAAIHRTAGLPMGTLEEAEASISSRTANQIVIAGAAWFLCYSLASLQRVGVTDPIAMIRAIANPRENYYAKFALLDTAQGSVIYQILNLTGVLSFLTIPYLLIHWGVLRRWVRGFAIISLSSYLLFYLSTGTQKGVADLAIALFASALPIYLLRRDGKGATAQPGINRRIQIAAVGAGLAGLTIITTSFGLRTDDTSTALQPPHARALYESLAPIFGSVGGRGLVILLDYLSQGYHGLALALQLPFVSTYGLGAYKALSSYLPQYFGLPDPYLASYPARVEQAFGWSTTGKWSSIYPWFASDAGFAGVILLALIFGFFLARVWRRLMLAGDALTLSVFVTCVIVVLFSPANNQLFNDRWSAIGVVTLLGLYLLREAVMFNAGRSKEGTW